MFIFIRLLLGHCIGDFPLQFNKIYELKHKGLTGGIPHALLVVLCYLLLCWPYLALPQLWSFILFLGILHLVQDSMKISFGKIKYSFWFYILDQLFHIAIIAAVFLTNLKNVTAPKNTGGLIVSLYNNDLLVLYLITLILATYNGLYLIRSYKVTFYDRPDVYSDFEKWHGIFERAVIVSIFFAGGYLFWVLPLLLAGRPVIFLLGRKRNLIRKHFISFQETALSWVIALLCGLLFYFLKQNFY